MQLIIDVPEESYEFAKECKARGCSKHNWSLTPNAIVIMIANGTPIPRPHAFELTKDHGYIDKDAGESKLRLRG